MKGFTTFLAVVFILFLSVSCSGNIATSIPIPTNTLSPTLAPSASPTTVLPTATPNPTATPVPVKPFDLGQSIGQIPELYIGFASAATIQQYTLLVSALPLEGQKWVIGMGQFLDDGSLDKAEVKLLVQSQ